MTKSSKVWLPACTASQVRIPIFAPTTKLAKSEKIKLSVESSWGKATIEGRLTQIHRSILDIALSGEYEQRRMSDGAIVVLTDMYGVLSRLGWERPGKWDAEWLVERVEELRVAKLTIEPKGTNTVVCTGIVGRQAYSKVTDERGNRKYAIQLTAEYVKYIEGDLPMRWRPEELRCLIELPGALQAVARHMRSHKHGTRYHVDTVLAAVNVRDDKDGGGFRRKRRQVLAHAAQFEVLKIGIGADEFLTRLE